MGANTASFDWFNYIREGGVYSSLLLFGAVIFLNTERVRLLKEVKEREIKIEALAERVIVLATEVRNFLFNERKMP